jgi:hypothetical protein
MESHSGGTAPVDFAVTDFTRTQHTMPSASKTQLGGRLFPICRSEPASVAVDPFSRNNTAKLDSDLRIHFVRDGAPTVNLGNSDF